MSNESAENYAERALPDALTALRDAQGFAYVHSVRDEVARLLAAAYAQGEADTEDEAFNRGLEEGERDGMDLERSRIFRILDVHLTGDVLAAVLDEIGD